MYTHDELVKALSDLLGDTISEQQQDQIFQRIGRKVLDPQWSDHVFHSDTFVDDHGHLDLEAVASKILSYHPVQL